MKKTLLLPLLFTTLLVNSFVGHSQNKQVALTSFWVSKHIGFEQLGGSAALAASIASLSENPDFNLQPVFRQLLQNVYRSLRKELSF